MAYATVAQFRAYFSHVRSEVSEPGTDALIQAVLDRATAIIDRVIDVAFDATSAVTTEVVYGDGTDFLPLPIDTQAGTVTAVTAPSGITVPDYVERPRFLVITRGGFTGRPLESTALLDYYSYTGWRQGVPYTIAATYGYTSVPADITEVCLELAGRIWRGKEAGFSDVVGVEGGGAVGYESALPALCKLILSKYTKARTVGIGVW